MNKSLLLVAVGVVVSLAACNKADENKAGPDAVAPANIAKAEAVPSPVITNIAAEAISEFDASQPASAIWTGKACDLKTPEGSSSLELAKGGEVVFEGYLIDPTDAPGGDFSLVLKGTPSYAIAMTTGQPRPDVAEYFKVPALASAGFAGRTALEGVAPGSYTMSFVMIRDGQQFFCDSGKTISVR